MPASWNQNGFEINKKIIADFAGELYQQGLTKTRLTPEAIFLAASKGEV
ncbi:MAG: hypothetical protein E6556_07375 [Pantoea sp.]|nr:hypothetical protein [Pantoea sp.]